ncbi:PqqD family protein [Halioglobus sp. Uisw_031]|uniref:PqqD family protein n=1 Tax=Halioglobus sp. Uisw_031 TaxID=3230977 RepID=UPI0039ED39F3
MLNDEGSAIWDALSQPQSLDEICTHLVSIYSVEVDQCRQDVQAWLHQACIKRVVVLMP